MHFDLLAIIMHRYDRFTDAFEHVSTVIDDIYKVCVYVFKCSTMFWLRVRGYLNMLFEQHTISEQE